MAKRETIPRLQAKARYLVRDTVKVTGSASGELAPATVGIFYVRPGNPLQGGTGHTIRVCHAHGVPVALQADWLLWPRP
jgi:hypothetical protein